MGVVSPGLSHSLFTCMPFSNLLGTSKCIVLTFPFLGPVAIITC
jgi:hypothetical protein